MSRGCESYPCDENCEKYSHMCEISVRLVSLKEKYTTLHKWRLYDFIQLPPSMSIGFVSPLKAAEA